jgi:hypothetical protein
VPERDILILSSSLLTDRMLLHTGVLEELRREGPVRVWATSARNDRYQDLWQASPAKVEEFPQVRPFKEFPYNYLRRLNEFVWDFRQRPPSRLSAMLHIRDKQRSATVQALKIPARALALMGVEQPLENWLEGVLLAYPRSPEARARLQERRPSVVVTTGPFFFTEPAVAAASMRLGIPTLALISSWDNVSTKGRLVLQYDGYLVWSEQTKRELHQFYPETRRVPIRVVGAPQFDVFFQDRFRQSREEFCAGQGLRPDLPIILYAVGSPNFIRGEADGALYMAERVARGDLGDAQLLVRPHPIHDNAELTGRFAKYAPRVVLQQTAEAGTALTARCQNEEQITEWVNTFLHADVVVNMFSTVTVDAAIFDRPVVNLDFDPEPGQPNQALIKDVNHLWTHFKPVAESGGVWNVDTPEELVEAVKGYLEHPELHREQRRWIAEHVCGFLDGRCGERLAQAILDFPAGEAEEAPRGSLLSRNGVTVGG